MLSNRKPPKSTPPDVRAKDERITQVRTYKLITPLYGGGAETQKPDEVTVVRASEIRGLLRFWWRATRGGQFGGSLKKMREAEEAIWGSAAGEKKAGPSPVSLAVHIRKRGRKMPDVTIRTRKGQQKVNIGDPRSPYGYVAFPLRDSRGSVWEGVEFELHITINRTTVKANGNTLNVAEEVEAVLWAWETFGGVGARTRRGFGALELVACTENGKPVPIKKPSSKDVERWVRDHLGKYVIDQAWPDGVPHVSPTSWMVFSAGNSDPLEIWQNLIEKLQNFRQKRHKKYGLSLWPEANVIRKVKGLSPKWPPNVRNPELVEKFPRAHFGLPIIFHMPHDKRLKDDFTVQGKAGPNSQKPINRLASPLILRPLACRDGYVGLALVLDTPREPPYGLEVDSFPPNKKNVRADLTKHEANTEPLRRVLDGEPDVLKAFLKTLGWKEK